MKQQRDKNGRFARGSKTIYPLIGILTLAIGGGFVLFDILLPYSKIVMGIGLGMGLSAMAIDYKGHKR